RGAHGIQVAIRRSGGRPRAVSRPRIYSRPHSFHGSLLRHDGRGEIRRAVSAEGSWPGGRPYQHTRAIDLVFHQSGEATKMNIPSPVVLLMGVLTGVLVGLTG